MSAAQDQASAATAAGTDSSGRSSLLREMGLFGIGGVLGFVVDAGVVTLLVNMGGLDPYLARVGSFLVAASVTWAWNRRFTFAHRRAATRAGEWLRWLASMSLGAAANYALYALLVAWLPLVHAWPALGVAAGSALGAVINFIIARRWVFRAGSGRE